MVQELARTVDLWIESYIFRLLFPGSIWIQQSYNVILIALNVAHCMFLNYKAGNFVEKILNEFYFLIPKLENWRNMCEYECNSTVEIPMKNKTVRFAIFW